MGIHPDLLKKIYYYLLLTRTLENQIEVICQSQNSTDPLIIGKGYLSTGQEAIAVGSALNLSEGDWLAPSHRDMGAHLVRGVTPLEIFRQYFCRGNSPTKGRDANVHFGHHEKHIAGFISHMGANASVANGLAAAMKYRGDKNFVLTGFGDGASSQGIVHEALNYAAVFKLPVIFMINNNQYAISTPQEEQFAVQDLASRAIGYGMPGFIVDGNDALAIYSKVKEAKEHALSGLGPVLIECKTLRVCGHGTHDSAQYVPKEKKTEWLKRDPLLVMKQHLDATQFSDQEEQAMKKEVRDLVEESWKKAAEEKAACGEDLLVGVYAGE